MRTDKHPEQYKGTHSGRQAQKGTETDTGNTLREKLIHALASTQRILRHAAGGAWWSRVVFDDGTNVNMHRSDVNTYLTRTAQAVGFTPECQRISFGILDLQMLSLDETPLIGLESFTCATGRRCVVAVLAR